VQRSDVAALIPAAGGGERLGLGPKAFVRVAGRPLLDWAVTALIPYVAEVVVAVPAAHQDEARQLAPQARVIVGGASRQATVAQLVAATSARYVLVHDAARPFLDADTIAAVIAALPQAQAVSVVMPVVDSLIDARDGSSVDRDALRAVQTPQAFERALLQRAHAQASAAGIEATDDAALVRQLGHAVELVSGGAHLLKITTSGDLQLAEAYAQRLLAAS